jgi:hypothetical protein
MALMSAQEPSIKFELRQLQLNASAHLLRCFIVHALIAIWRLGCDYK